jgi:hypothetical protein
LVGTPVVSSLENISHLQDLTELSLTLDDFATALIIHRIASVFPRLRTLELGNSSYLYSDKFCFDVRDVSASAANPLTRVIDYCP